MTEIPPQLIDQQIADTTNLAEANFFTDFLATDVGANETTAIKGRDALQLYIEVAAEALNHIDSYDPSSAKVLRQVIDYLASDSRLKPEELDYLRKNNAELSFNLNTLQKKYNNQNYELTLANHRIDEQTEIIDNLRRVNAEMDYELQSKVKTVDAYTKQIKELNLKNQEILVQQLEIKKQRDDAVKRQNAIMAQNVHQKTAQEVMQKDMDKLQKKLQQSLNTEQVQRQKIADKQLKIEEHLETIHNLKQQLTQLQTQYEQQQNIHNLELDQIGQRLDIAQKDKNNLATKNKALTDQVARLNQQLREYKKNSDVNGNMQFNITLEENKMQPIINQSARQFVMPGVDESIQVYTSVRRIKENHEEIILDDSENIMDKLKYINAELSETSNNDNFDPNYDEIIDDDSYSMILRKIKTQFVKRSDFDAIQKKLEKSQYKYNKYKIKYETISHEITIQGMLKQYHAIDEAIQQLDETLQNSGIDSVEQSVQKNLRLLRISLESKLLRVEEDIQEYLNKVNISQLKLLVGEKLIRKSRDNMLNDEILQRANQIKNAPPQVQCMLAGLNELLMQPEERVEKIEKQMKTQKQVMEKFITDDKKNRQQSHNIKKANKIAQKINKTLEQKLDIERQKNTKFSQTTPVVSDIAIQCLIKEVNESQVTFRTIDIQTDELESPPELMEADVQATVDCYDIQLQTETVKGPETKDQDVQVNFEYVTKRPTATTVRNTTYKLVTIEKSDLQHSLHQQELNYQEETSNTERVERADSIPQLSVDETEYKINSPQLQNQHNSKHHSNQNKKSTKNNSGSGNRFNNLQKDSISDQKQTQNVEIEPIQQTENITRNVKSKSKSRSASRTPVLMTDKSVDGGPILSQHDDAIQTSFVSQHRQNSIVSMHDIYTQYSLEGSRPTSDQCSVRGRGSQSNSRPLSQTFARNTLNQQQAVNMVLVTELDDLRAQIREKIAEIERLRRQLSQQGGQQLVRLVSANVQTNLDDIKNILNNHQSFSGTSQQIDDDKPTSQLSHRNSRIREERYMSRRSYSTSNMKVQNKIDNENIVIEPNSQIVHSACQVVIDTEDTIQMCTDEGQEEEYTYEEVDENEYNEDEMIQLVKEPTVGSQREQLSSACSYTNTEPMAKSQQPTTSVISNTQHVDTDQNDFINVLDTISQEVSSNPERKPEIVIQEERRYSDVSESAQKRYRDSDTSPHYIARLLNIHPQNQVVSVSAGVSVNTIHTAKKKKKKLILKKDYQQPPAVDLTLSAVGVQQQISNNSSNQLARINSILSKDSNKSNTNPITIKSRPVVQLTTTATQTNPPPMNISKYAQTIIVETREQGVQLDMQFAFFDKMVADDYVSNQFKLLTQEKERYRQQGIQLQDHVEQLQEQIASMKKERAIQNSIITQFQNFGNKPRVKTEDKITQTQISYYAIDALQTQIILQSKDITKLIQLNDQYIKEKTILQHKLKELGNKYQINSDIIKLIDQKNQHYQPVAILAPKSILSVPAVEANMMDIINQRKKEIQNTNKISSRRGSEELQQSLKVKSFSSTDDVNQEKQDIPSSMSLEFSELQSIEHVIKQDNMSHRSRHSSVKQLPELKRPDISSMQDAKLLIKQLLETQAIPEKPITADENESEFVDEYEKYYQINANQLKVTDKDIKGFVKTLALKNNEAQFTIPKITRQRIQGPARSNTNKNLIVQQKLRMLDIMLKPEVKHIPKVLPMIHVKCKRDKGITYRIDQNGRYSYVSTNNQPNKRPIVKEYIFQNNYFISPFTEALEQRKIRRLQRRLNNNANREKDLTILTQLDYNEAEYLKIENPQNELDQHFLESSNAISLYNTKSNISPNNFSIQKRKDVFIPAVIRRRGLYLLLANINDQPAPSVINANETKLFAKYNLTKIFDWKVETNMQLINIDIEMQKIQEGDLAQQKKCEIGNIIYYAQVKPNGYFEQVFNQFLECPVVLSQNNKQYVKLPPGCQIKALAVLLKTIRLFYYENVNNLSFVQFLQNKFMSKLMISKFIGQFYVSILYHLQNNTNKNEILELILFYYIYVECSNDKQRVNDFIAFRKLLFMDQDNPNMMSLERQLDINEQRADMAKINQIIKTAVTNIPPTSLGNFTQYLSNMQNLTRLQLLYVINQISIQLQTKQYARYIQQFDKYEKDKIDIKDVIEIVSQSLIYLKKETIEAIVQKWLTVKRNNSFEITEDGQNAQFSIYDVLSIAQQFVQLDMQRDDLLAECSRKFRFCEELLRIMIDKKEIKDRDQMAKLQEQRDQVRQMMGQRSGAIALLYCNQYYESLLRLQRTQQPAKSSEPRAPLVPVPLPVAPDGPLIDSIDV